MGAILGKLGGGTTASDGFEIPPTPPKFLLKIFSGQLYAIRTSKIDFKRFLVGIAIFR